MKLRLPVILVVLASCTEASPPPERRVNPTIVSLNPCSDAVLAEVADPAQLLAISRYSHDPASTSMDVAFARQFRTVSGSAEEVLALRPDIVVAGTFFPATTRTALERQGIRVELVPIATSIAESKAQVARLAKLAGNDNAGTALNAEIEAALARAAPLRTDSPMSAVVWQAGGIVPGEGTLIADILHRTGFANFSAARGLKQADFLPLEEMLADPPEVILAAGNSRANEDRLLSHPALGYLLDTRRERLDPSLLWCGGRTIIRAARRLRQVREGLRS